MNRISVYHPLIVLFAQRAEKIPGVPNVASWSYFVGYCQQPNMQLPRVAHLPTVSEADAAAAQLQAMARTHSSAMQY